MTATVGHPFWVSNDDDLAAAKAPRTGLGRWASADHLKAGDHLTSAALVMALSRWSEVKAPLGLKLSTT